MSDIDKFILAIKNEEFIQAHELLENQWKEYKKQGLKTKAKYIQALINGATALALYKIKNRPQAYIRVWSVFTRNKDLILDIELDEKEKFIEASKILEQKNKKIVDKDFLGI